MLRIHRSSRYVRAVDLETPKLIGQTTSMGTQSLPATTFRSGYTLHLVYNSVYLEDVHLVQGAQSG